MNVNNVNKTLDRNFRFLGHLDSAKTGLNVQSPSNSSNWWNPASVETQLLHCAAAEAITVKQVFNGEIIQLPRNQSFDSPAWLKLADLFIKSKHPLFSICLIGNKATPEAFVEDCSQQFMPSPSSPFALSGWPILDDDQRKIIANNLSKKHNFKGMFDGFRLDNNWKEIFEYQRDVLQNVLQYLEKNYTVYPHLIRTVDYAQTTTWDRIERDYTDSKFIAKMKYKHGDKQTSNFLSVLQEIKAKAEINDPTDVKKQNLWLSKRTNLFLEIADQPHELKEMLRAEIDRCYMETTAESVTGIGRFGDADRSDTGRDINDRDYDSQIFDYGNDPSGLNELYIINFKEIDDQGEINNDLLKAIRDELVSSQTQEMDDKQEVKKFLFNEINDILITTQTQEMDDKRKTKIDFIETINDDLVFSTIQNLRRIRNLHNIPKEEMDKLELEHLDFLHQTLPEVVIRSDRKYDFYWETAKFSVSILIGIGVSTFFGPTIEKIGSVAAPVLGPFIDQAIATATDKTALSDKVKEKIIQKITKKRKIALTGFFRDWLSGSINLQE